MNIIKKRAFLIGVIFLFFGLAFLLQKGIHHKPGFDNHSYAEMTEEVAQVNNLRPSIVSNIVENNNYVEPQKVPSAFKSTFNAKAELIQKHTTDEYSGATLAEPTLDNISITAVGSFSDQVNFINPEDDCIENCINTETTHLAATGYLAEQVNTKALTKYAEMTGLLDSYAPHTIELAEATDTSGPPTEKGAYIIPQETFDDRNY